MAQRQQAHIPNPARTIAASFLSAIVVGTLLLLLPISTVSGKISIVDALFTATSAVCVVGLIVVDTGSYFTRFGQSIIAVLIQLGGLGIMTFSVFFLSILGKRATLTDRMAFRTISEKFSAVNLFRMVLFILSVTLIIEAAGAICYFPRFQKILPAGEAAFYSLFHSVSAFCNSGFSLFRTSLEGFQQEYSVPGVTMILIILGGIGFFVLTDGFEKVRNFILRKGGIRISLHTKLVLTTTVFLIVSGTAVIWLLERDNVLAQLPLPFQVWNSIFQSITPRTAGFNTLPTGSLSDATLLFLCMFMFIGGAPTSAAGGIKVTTLAILLALVFCKARGQESASIFRRKIPEDIIARSVTIFAASFAFVNLMAFLLLITEHRGLPHGALPGRFLDLFFEVISAFGTVGLSTGATPSLTVAGKLLIIFTMFAGRVGPLTLALAIVSGRKRETHYEYAEEEVMIG